MSVYQIVRRKEKQTYERYTHRLHRLSKKTEIVAFNVPLDEVSVISETVFPANYVHVPAKPDYVHEHS